MSHLWVTQSCDTKKVIKGFGTDNVMNLFLKVGNKNNPCIRETQENSIEFLRQSSLPYIL